MVGGEDPAGREPEPPTMTYAQPLPLTADQISVTPITTDETIAVRVALPFEVCERVIAWVRASRYERVGRWIPMNMFVEDDYEDASFFWLDETPCSVGQFRTGFFGEGDLFTGIEVRVPGEGPELDWTVPHDQFGLDGRLTAVRLIRRLLEIGATYEQEKAH